EKKIRLGLDIKGGTSFLIRLVKGDKEVTKGMLGQAVEVIESAWIILAAANQSSVPSVSIASLFKSQDWILPRSRKRAISFRVWQDSSFGWFTPTMESGCKTSTQVRT